jgi:hypothetical protein
VFKRFDKSSFQAVSFFLGLFIDGKELALRHLIQQTVFIEKKVKKKKPSEEMQSRCEAKKVLRLTAIKTKKKKHKRGSHIHS